MPISAMKSCVLPFSNTRPPTIGVKSTIATSPSRMGRSLFNRAKLSMALDKFVQFRLYLLIGYIDRRFMDFQGFVDRQLERRADIDQRRVRKCAALFEMRLAYVSLGERFEVGFFERSPKVSSMNCAETSCSTALP